MRTYHMAVAQSRSLSLLRRQCWVWSRRLCSEQPDPPPRRTRPSVSVQDERVQALLSQLTGMDLDKVFAARKEPLMPPTYKLLTLEELEKVETSVFVEIVCMMCDICLTFMVMYDLLFLRSDFI